MGEPTGYRESPDTTDAPAEAQGTVEGTVEGTMVDGTPGEDPADRGERDTESSSAASLTTDDDAQADDGTARPGNLSS
jgi:hypothetical protein